MKQDLRNSPIGDHASNLGGLIAYEMAQQLTASGYQVDLVALIDSAVPGGIVQKQDDSTKYFDIVIFF